jgi:hypothetical protein
MGMSSPLSQPPISSLLEEISSFKGTAKELLEEVKNLASENATREPGWPRTPRGLSGILKRLAPNLRAKGIHVQFYRSNCKRLIEIKAGDE